MHFTDPKVYIIGQTSVNREGLEDYLTSIGAKDWGTDASTDVEEIIEVMSRSCYKSFGTELNPNITEVREGNEAHLENILESGHGSVLEHGWISFMFVDVSRVLTHELVRHRVGVAVSQESLRFVRADDIGFWMSPTLVALGNIGVDIRGMIKRHQEVTEELYRKLLTFAARQQGVGDFSQLSFQTKKQYTSAFRRILPIGISTNIGWSCNMRALRHVIEMRADPAAEEEIYHVFNMVRDIVVPLFPAIFPDYVNGPLYERV